MVKSRFELRHEGTWREEKFNVRKTRFISESVPPIRRSGRKKNFVSCDSAKARVVGKDGAVGGGVRDRRQMLDKCMI